MRKGFYSYAVVYSHSSSHVGFRTFPFLALSAFAKRMVCSEKQPKQQEEKRKPKIAESARKQLIVELDK